MTRGGEAVGEGDAPAGRVTGIRPVTGLEQHRAQHPELHHLAAHAVDLDPVAEADAVLAHQHEPADEGDDEILERDREAGAREPHHGAELPRHPDDDQHDEHHAENLQRDPDHAAKRPELAAVDGGAPEEALQPAVGEEQREERGQHDRHAAQAIVQEGALLSRKQRVPLAVDVGEPPARRDSLVAERQAALLGGELAGDADQARSGARRARAFRAAGCGGRRRGARRHGFGPGRLRGRGSPRGRRSGRPGDG